MPTNLPELSVIPALAARADHEWSTTLEVVGPWGSGKALTAVQLAQRLNASILYVTAGRIETEAAFEDLCSFTETDRCVMLPAWEVLPTDAMKPADDIVAERMNALKGLSLAVERGTPVYAAVSVRSLLQRVVNAQHLLRDSVSLSVGKEYDLEDLVHRLVTTGYERELMVEQRGQLSVRGGIFDIFPISSELPYRIEFFGDEIESIRRFEPETQRSVDQLQEVHILPRSEKKLIFDEAAGDDLFGTITDYLPERTIIVLDEPLAVQEEAERLERQFGDSRFMKPLAEVLGAAEKFLQLRIAQVGYKKSEALERFTLPMRSMAGWRDRVDGFWEQLQEWDQGGYTVQVYCNNAGERRRLMELMEERGYTPGSGNFDLRLAIGRLREGFASVDDKLAVLSEREIFGRKYVRRTRRRFTAGAAITAFSDLKAGDYVVHLHHGIGRYLGLKRFEGKSADFLAIQYQGGDIMYLPVSHVDMVQKYIGGDGALPKIDRIGGQSWTKTKAKVKTAVKDMTQELLKLYAARESQEGHAYSNDTHWQQEFEDSFEYDETPDQLRAIIDVKTDMQSRQPMERLLCGDVGYGKTEVALRAAFKAVMDHKQVAVLVPTTVLAEQHYNTFKERLADYPVRVEMLSRFRTPAQQKEIVHKLRDGEIDIIVGTHRLTSGDVKFKDLGLVVLDEEQRFGVKHKERLKQLKTNVDVLTMSATPIPRTMHMALMGIRDMSVINTAPNDRLPIHTCIDAFDEDLVKEAIERELAREGQVFYLHNRVQSIAKVAELVKKLVPHARVGIGHGQMPEHDLEEVMTRFIRKDIDVLVCTTIIGSGLDIPNANTIIVDRADQFGLSELYQLRGRVGRYKHRAFAYLLVPGDRALTEDAQKRLKALEEFSTLGAGFRIAMRDLEIRGAGNLLGQQQSGNIAAVGYDTYTQLIQEAVSEIKGQPVRSYTLPQFDVAVDGYIPEEYVPAESQKITLYKRISTLRTMDELNEMVSELTDRFGPPPGPVKRLLDVMRVRILAGESGAKRVIATKNAVVAEFDSVDVLGKDRQFQLRERFGKNIEFAFKTIPSVTCNVQNGEDTVKIAERLLSALAEG